MIDTRRGLDIFGDIHGRARALFGGLKNLGYEKKGDVWRHPHGRRALFLGDLIDRGDGNREVVDAVRAMTIAGEAMCLMGNHEFNAVHYALPDEKDGFLRPRSDVNTRQHYAFLAAHAMIDNEGNARRSETASYRDHIDWFKTLPVAARLDGLHAVHAAWTKADAALIRTRLNGWRIERPDDWREAADPQSALGAALANMLKGPEIALPAGCEYRDKDGVLRAKARVKWWRRPRHFADAVILPDAEIEHLPAAPLCAAIKEITRENMPTPVVFGHYWRKPLNGRPSLLDAPNRLCLDFSIGAAHGGLLGVYRWDGEQQFNASKLYGVDREGRISS